MNGLEYMNKICPTTSRGKDPNREDVADAFDDGIAYGYKEAIEKSCEWLKDYVTDYLDRDEQYQLPIIDVVELITDFRKEMEEQQ